MSGCKPKRSGTTKPAFLAAIPPADGIGIGIDRLCPAAAGLPGQESIRDVILFPQLKPSKVGTARCAVRAAYQRNVTYLHTGARTFARWYAGVTSPRDVPTYRAPKFFRQIPPAVASCTEMPSDLERLYDAHAQGIFAFVLNLTRNDADTRDVLQQIFVKLASRPQLLRNVRDERGFLLRLAHNLAIDLMRRRATREKNYAQFAVEADSVFEASKEADEQSFRSALSEALGALPMEQRAVAHLKLWEDFTFEAISETLDISANTAASRYRYAIDKLRERLRPLYDEIK